MICPHCGMSNDPDFEFCQKCGMSLARVTSEIKDVQPEFKSRTVRLMALFTYALGWMSAIIFYVLERDTYVKFHALQSIITFGGFTAVLTILSAFLPPDVRQAMGTVRIVSVEPSPLMIAIWLITALMFVIWFILMYKAYQGTMFKLPFIGKLAYRLSNSDDE